MKKITTEEYKEDYKSKILSYAYQNVGGDLNWIWERSFEDLLQQYEEDGIDVSGVDKEILDSWLPEGYLDVVWVEPKKD
tara:strand:+ start:545 stop:781 length:237 start_codon:yes stop_codon:yes gene_type:complete